MNIITRDNIKEKLLLWKEGKINSRDLLEFSDLYVIEDNYELEDWEGGLPNSISSEVLGIFQMIDLDPITREDVPYILYMLDTPLGDFEKAYGKWVSYYKDKNLDKIIAQVKNDPLFRNDPFYEDWITSYNEYKNS